jgi:hypothetical protein
MVSVGHTGHVLLGVRLPDGHEIFLVITADDIQFVYYRDLIMSDAYHRICSVARGEFQYVATRTTDGGMSMWLFVCMSMRVCAITMTPDGGEFTKLMRRIEWRERDSDPPGASSGT